MMTTTNNQQWRPKTDNDDNDWRPMTMTEESIQTRLIMPKAIEDQQWWPPRPTKMPKDIDQRSTTMTKRHHSNKTDQDKSDQRLTMMMMTNHQCRCPKTILTRLIMTKMTKDWQRWWWLKANDNYSRHNPN